MSLRFNETEDLTAGTTAGEPTTVCRKTLTARLRTVSYVRGVGKQLSFQLTDLDPVSENVTTKCTSTVVVSQLKIMKSLIIITYILMNIIGVANITDHLKIHHYTDNTTAETEWKEMSINVYRQYFRFLFCLRRSMIRLSQQMKEQGRTETAKLFLWT